MSNKSIRQIWKELRLKYEVMRADKPLALGALQQLAVNHLDLTPEEIRAVLGRHTKTTTYLRGVKFGDKRFNLDGTEAQSITDAQRECARLHLNERNQKRTFTMIDQIKPVKSEKKAKMRKARHEQRLVKIQGKLKAAIAALSSQPLKVCQAELDGVPLLVGKQ
jgi:ProP effector